MVLREALPTLKRRWLRYGIVSSSLRSFRVLTLSIVVCMTVRQSYRATIYSASKAIFPGTNTVWTQTLPQHFAVVRMILCSWKITIPCLSFSIQQDAISTRARRFHLHQSHLLYFLRRMALPFIFPIIYAVHPPFLTQDTQRPPSRFRVLVSCHRFIKQHLPTMRMRSRRRMRVLQFHIPQTLIRQESVLQLVLQLWRQPQRRNRESASVAIGKIVIIELRIWTTWSR